MLAAERRSELGIARAIGTRRGHLVSCSSSRARPTTSSRPLVGALLGAAVAYVMVLVMAGASASRASTIEYAVQPRSLLIGYASGCC